MLVGSKEMMVEVMEGPVELSEAGYVVKGVVDAGEVTFETGEVTFVVGASALRRMMWSLKAVFEQSKMMK